MAQMVAARPGMLHACIERHAFLTHKRTHTNTPRSMPGGLEQQGEQNKQIGRFDESGRIFVSRALNDTKEIGKAGANIFSKFGLEKP